MAFLLIAITINFSACKKDSVSSQIVGTWQLSHYHEAEVDLTTNPATVKMIDSSFALILKFSGDGSAVSYMNALPSLGNAGGYTLSGNDSISYVFGPGAPPVKAKYTIQGATLTLVDQPRYLYDSLHYFTSTQTYVRLK